MDLVTVQTRHQWDRFYLEPSLSVNLSQLCGLTPTRGKNWQVLIIDEKLKVKYLSTQKISPWQKDSNFIIEYAFN